MERDCAVDQTSIGASQLKLLQTYPNGSHDCIIPVIAFGYGKGNQTAEV